MSALPDLIFTGMVEALRDCQSCMSEAQAHAICLAVSRAFSPDRPDSFEAGRQAERTRILALLDLRLEQLGAPPFTREHAENRVTRAAILESVPTPSQPCET